MISKNIWHAGVAAVLLVSSGFAGAVGDMVGGPKVNQINLGEPVTSIARGQHFIHDFLMWVCLIIFVGVFAVMFYSMWAHRKSKRPQAGRIFTRAPPSRSSGPSFRS